MSKRPRSAAWWLVPLGILLAAAPPVAYWTAVGNVPSIEPRDARTLLSALKSPGYLVDVRPATEFREDDLGADNWPLDKVLQLKAGDPQLRQFESKRVLVLCDAGFLSARAVRRLRSLSIDATAVAGGIEGWRSAARKLCAAQFARGRGVSTADLKPFFHRPMPVWRQWLAWLTNMVSTPLYMMVTLGLIAAIGYRSEPDMKALRRGLWAFFFGEIFCLVNSAVLDAPKMYVDYLHSVGMVVSFGFVTYAVLDGVDRRIIRYSDGAGHCAAAGLCGGCARNCGGGCGLQRVFLVVIAALALTAVVPMLARPEMVSYNTTIRGGIYSYVHPLAAQMLEGRYLPAVAVALFAAAFAVLAVRKTAGVPLSKTLLAAGSGAFGFGLMRTGLFAMYRHDLMWFGFWDENSELAFVLAVAAVLWTFRRTLLAKPALVQETHPRRAPATDRPAAAPGGFHAGGSKDIVRKGASNLRAD